MMSVYVVGVLFNHQLGQNSSAALPLRYNHSTPVLLPEWRFGQIHPSVVAYVIDKLPEWITIHVQFYSTVPCLRGVEFQARAEWPLSSLTARAMLPLDLPLNTVDFNANGMSAWSPFTIKRDALPSSVGVTTFGWHWDWRMAGSQTWSTAQITTHKIYSVLSSPTAPWSAEIDSSDLPRTDALDYACLWAEGATDAIQVASRITKSVYDLGGLTVTYDALIGAPHYTTLGIPTFLINEFINRLQGGFGSGPLVNCSDCATIVSTFANLLGTDLWQSKMGLIGAGFGLNPIKAIGSRQWSRLHGSFGFHEVAWSGDCLNDDLVYDACINLDSDGDPGTAPHKQQIPSAIVFGRAGENQYRDKLASAESRHSCEPQPDLKVRRSIGDGFTAMPGLPAEVKAEIANRYQIGLQNTRMQAYRFEDFTWFGGEIPGWILVSRRVFGKSGTGETNLPPEAEPPSRVIVTLWRTVEDAGKLLRIESMEASCNDTARQLLIQSAAQIQNPGLEKWVRRVEDESALSLRNGEIALFTRCNHLHIARSAGSKRFNVRKIANAIDDWLVNAGESDPRDMTAQGPDHVFYSKPWIRRHLVYDDMGKLLKLSSVEQHIVSITAGHARRWQRS